MLFKLALRQIRTDKRLALIVFLAISLVAGFAALHPLYRDRLVTATAQTVVDAMPAEMAAITLNNPGPIDPAVMVRLESVFGDRMTEPVRYSRAPGNPEYPGLGKICGYTYVQGETLTINTEPAISTADHCYIPYSFTEPEAVFALVAGRWPDVLPEQPRETPRIMGDPQVEAVLAAEVAELIDIQIGDRIVIGEQAERAVIVEIVGLVAPALSPKNAFWHGHSVALTGDWTQIGDDMRLELGPIVPPEAFDRWIVPLTETAYYAWWLTVDSGTLGAAQLDALDGDLYHLESALRLTHPDIEMLTGLRAVTAQYRDQRTQFEDTVIVVGAVLLALLLAQIVAVMLLVFDHRRAEWHLLSAQGASRRQLILVMLVAWAGLSIFGALAGLVWAGLLLELLSPVAPPGDMALTTELLNTRTLITSIGGAAIAMIVLALPAWIVARRSQRPPRPPVSYPPEKPIWARVYLDVLLIAAGCAALSRLYYLASDGFLQSLRDLASDPGLLTERIAASQAGAKTSGLGDIFNLAGPVLILIGGLLLWQRIYPWLVRAPARVFRRRGGLTGLLALRQVACAPGQYTALALMLAGSLVLGAALLALEATHDSAAWHTARHTTGADAQLAFDLGQTPPDPAWVGLPGVTSATALIRLDAIQPPMTIVGIDPAALPETAAIPAFGAPIDTLPGIALPDSIAALEVAMYSVPNPNDPGVESLSLVLLDRRGVPVTLPMAATSGAVGEFVTHRVALPGEPTLVPWRLIGFRFASTRREPHTIYLDRILALDAQDKPTVIEDFEADALTGWVGSMDQPQNAVLPEHSTEQAADGTASLRIEYETKYTYYADLQPIILATPPDFPRLPVIVSAAFLESQSQRTENEPRLGLGDTSGIRLELPLGGFWLPYQIVGIVPDFPTLSTEERFIVAPFDALRLLLNASVMSKNTYDINQVWLELDGRAPDTALQQDAPELPGVVEVAYAWNRFDHLKHDPLLLAVAGLLRFGFGVAASLSLLYVVTHRLIVVARRREALAVLNTLGWRHRVGRALTFELVVLALPLLVVSVLMGTLLVYLLMPFLALISGETLHLPFGAILGLWVGTAGLLIVVLGGPISIKNR